MAAPGSSIIRKKDESLLDKIGGTLVKKKKAKEGILICFTNFTLIAYCSVIGVRPIKFQYANKSRTQLYPFVPANFFQYGKPIDYGEREVQNKMERYLQDISQCDPRGMALFRGLMRRTSIEAFSLWIRMVFLRFS